MHATGVQRTMSVLLLYLRMEDDCSSPVDERLSTLRRGCVSQPDRNVSAQIGQNAGRQPTRSTSLRHAWARDGGWCHHDLVEGVSPREAEVLDLLASHQTNAEIARRLFI